MSVPNGVLVLSLTWLMAPTSSFSGFNRVHVKGRGILAMELITIGDEVMVQDGTFSRIYSFGQRDPLKLAEFRQIDTDCMDAPLEITPDRMVFVYNITNTTLTHLIPASNVNIGDYLVTEPEKPPAKVLLIRTVKRYGVYSPLTLSGTIVVSGIAVSNFMTLPLPLDSTYHRQHAIQQAAYAYFRFFCNWIGDCREETSKTLRLFNYAVDRQYSVDSSAPRLGRLILLVVAFICSCTFAVVIIHHCSGRNRVMHKRPAHTKPSVEIEEVTLDAIEAVVQQPSTHAGRERHHDDCISELFIEQAQTDSVEVVHAKIETEVTTPRCRNQKLPSTLAQ